MSDANQQEARFWEFLQKYLEMNRQHVESRLRLDTQLLNIKMIALATLFGVFFGGRLAGENQLYFIWFFPVVAIVMDYAIFQNVITINIMAAYIHDKIEKKILPLAGRGDFKLWETYYIEKYSRNWDRLRSGSTLIVSLIVASLSGYWLYRNACGWKMYVPVFGWAVLFLFDIFMWCRSNKGELEKIESKAHSN